VGPKKAVVSIGAHNSIYRGEIRVITDLKTGKGQPCTVHVATPKEQHSCSWYGWLKHQQHWEKTVLGGGFKDFLCSPLPGEMIQFD